MPITKKEVEHVAMLARLGLTEDEAAVYTAQLQRILSHVEKLSALDVKDVAAPAQTGPGNRPLRDDGARAAISREEAMENGPETERGYFKVPRIIE